MKKIFSFIILPIVFAVAGVNIFLANNTASLVDNSLNLDDVEMVASAQEITEPGGGGGGGNTEKSPYYERYKACEWYGDAQGNDGRCHYAHFIDWGCKPGWVLDSCMPYTEVVIYY